MKRERFLTIAVVSLIIINAAIVIYLFIGRQRPERPELFKMIVKELNFNDQQRERFFKLRDEHHRTMMQLDDQFKTVLTSYLNLLSRDRYELSLRDSLENEMAAIEKQKAAVTLSHFEEVKTICTPEQKEKFNKLVPEFAVVIGPNRNGRPPFHGRPPRQ